ncbi:hypothetical protein Prudu_006131, partial [Prunus dulcis]
GGACSWIGAWLGHKEKATRCQALWVKWAFVEASRLQLRQGDNGLGMRCGLRMPVLERLPVDQPCLLEMVKLLKSRTNNERLVDVSDPDARIITFRPFYFSLGFKFLLSKHFKEVFCAMGCAPSQCTPNVDRAIMHFEQCAQVRIYKAKLFNSLSQEDHAWHNDVLKVSGRKQLELGPNMAKVRRALNIPLRFREWRWLLSEYREEDGGLPPAEDVKRWKQKGHDPDDLLGGQEEYYAESLSKRKAAAKYSRGEATSSHVKDGSSLRKKPRLPSAEKTQVGSVPSSSARVKHLVGADNTKVGGMRGTRGVLPEPPTDTLENHDMFHEAARARPSSAERQRDADIPPRSSSRLHRSKDGDRNGRSAHDLALLTHLEMRLAEAKKMRESSTRVKGSSSTSAVGPRVNKFSSVGDACVSDLLKMNFLSNPSSCAELVDHIRQVCDLGTFSCLSLEKQRDATFHLIQKGLIFAAETIRNLSLSELEKKNAELATQFSAEQALYEKKTSDLRAMISGLKSSFTEKDSELNSFAANLASRKDAFFRLEHKNTDISLLYDKILARFHAYHKSAKEFKSKATIDAYKLGYLHCADETNSLYAIDDVDIKMLCPNLPPVEGGTEEQVTGEDEVEVDAVDKMMADAMVQADGATEGVAGQRFVSTRVPLKDSRHALHIRRMVPLRKLASTRFLLEGLRVCSAHPVGCLVVALRLPQDAAYRQLHDYHVPFGNG